MKTWVLKEYDLIWDALRENAQEIEMEIWIALDYYDYTDLWKCLLTDIFEYVYYICCK